VIVDFHTHWTDDFSDDLAGWERWWSAPAAYGITHAVVLPFRGLLHAGYLREDNDRVAAVAARSGGRAIPFCSLHPSEGDAAVAELQRCIDAGHRGVKFHPWLQGASVLHPTMDAIAAAAAGHGVPLFFHDGTPPFSLPAQIALLAQRHPETPFVLGHGGILEHWREAAAAQAATPNLWLCICGPHAAGTDHLLTHANPDRLLWGTDHGFGPKSGGLVAYRKPLMDRSPRFSDELRDRVYRRNPARLLGMADEA
jgi:predicted TIM-barrel fold metal-dependent hydrolase